MEFKGNVQCYAMDDKENVDSGLNAQEEVKEFATDGKIEMLEDEEI